MTVGIDKTGCDRKSGGINDLRSLFLQIANGNDLSILNTNGCRKTGFSAAVDHIAIGNQKIIHFHYHPLQ